MEKEFIPYKQALALKELGFDKPCFAYYLNKELNIFHSTSVNDRINSKTKDIFSSDVIVIPLYQQAFRWFREKYKIECYVNSYWNENDSSKRTYYANYNYGSDIFYTITKEFETHEEAELECLKKLIEIVKDGKK